MIVVVAGSWREGASVATTRQFGPFGSPVEMIFWKLLAHDRLHVSEIERLEVLTNATAPSLAGHDDLRATASFFLASRQARKWTLIFLEASGQRAGLLKAKKPDLGKLMDFSKASRRHHRQSPMQARPNFQTDHSGTGVSQFLGQTLRAVAETAGWIVGGAVAIAMIAALSKSLLPVAAVLFAGVAVAGWMGKLKRYRFASARATGAAYLALVSLAMFASGTAPSRNVPAPASIKSAESRKSPQQISPPDDVAAKGDIWVHEKDIKAGDFVPHGKTWPFVPGSGKVGCDRRNGAIWYTSPDGNRYALNGVANTRLSLPWPDDIWQQDYKIAMLMKKQTGRWPTPEESGRASISDVSDAAQQLCE